MNSAVLTIDELVNHAASVASGTHETLRPGMPEAFSEACDVGDMIWQGDLGIGLVAGGPPAGYVRSDNVLTCLVPNSDKSIGSRHCLESSEGVEMWLPAIWDETVLSGPYLRLTNGAKITHPVHGDVSIPSCFTEVQIIYQREWDQEQARERRAKD